MSARTLSLDLPSPDATHRLAAALAPHLKGGDVLLLSGEIGAGKTHFARGLILALLDTPEDIPSPTYTLVQTYAVPGAEIWHADLYRLTDVAEVEELGLTDAFATAICLVEWPDRLGDLAPLDAITLDFAPGGRDDARILTFFWSVARWDPLIKGLANDGS